MTFPMVATTLRANPCDTRVRNVGHGYVKRMIVGLESNESKKLNIRCT